MTDQATANWYNHVSGRLAAADHTVFVLLQTCITTERQRQFFIETLEATIGRYSDETNPVAAEYKKTMTSYVELARSMKLSP